MSRVKLRPSEIFNIEFHGSHNPMTPDILCWGKLNKFFYYELAEGEGLWNSEMFGLTILFFNPLKVKTQRTFNMSLTFPTLDTALAGIAKLKEASVNSMLTDHSNSMKKLNSEVV